MALRPFDKMIRVIRIRAHALRPHIKQVAVKFGSVGHSATESGGALNEEYRDLCASVAQQLDRHHCAAETAADNRDRQRLAFTLIRKIHLAIHNTRISIIILA